MYCAYKLNKQHDNIQPWCTPFPILNQFIVPCLVLTVASWCANRFLRRQVRWSGIPISLKIVHSLLWSSQPQNWKMSILIPIPKKGNAKECLYYGIVAFISHASNVMLKILQAKLQQYSIQELLEVQVGFRKGRGTRNQIAIIWIIEKKIFPFYFCFIDYATAFDCLDHNKLWKILKWKWKSLSHVQLFATPWTIQSMEFSRPEYWSGEPFPSLGDLPKPSDWTQVSHITGRFFTSWVTRETQIL